MKTFMWFGTIVRSMVLFKELKHHINVEAQSFPAEHHLVYYTIKDHSHGVISIIHFTCQWFQC